MIRVSELRFAWSANGPDCLAFEHLEVAAGKTLFLYGPSGSGKSTLLGLLAGVLVPRQGTVELLGVDWAALPASRRDARRADHVGYIFQQFNLLPYLNALDNVLLPCRFSTLRTSRAQAQAGSVRSAAQSLLQHVGLGPNTWGKPAGALSVGQQQRVAAARALIGAPEVVIADEPTSALDSALRDSFLALLLAQCHAAGSALVFVSHDRQLAAHFDIQVSLADLNQAAPEESAA
ncbi:MAG: ATP-binding cassette domain-containing protein [Burkholderiaceae bacterium]